MGLEIRRVVTNDDPNKRKPKLSRATTASGKLFFTITATLSQCMQTLTICRVHCQLRRIQVGSMHSFRNGLAVRYENMKIERSSQLRVQLSKQRSGDLKKQFVS
jgi:hypothetical protein